MLSIDNTLISEDIFDSFFCCSPEICRGTCCLEGDAGAPLEEQEVAIIEDCLPLIKPYLSPQAWKTIIEKGVFDYDTTGNLVTPLVQEKECVFAVFEDGIVKCAIEKSFFDKKIHFQKPISCHLYPIRIENYQFYHILRYEQWHICRSAEKKGKKLQISVFEFLQEPLKRRFGEEWIEKVKIFLQYRTTL
jgi:hypothetical protein